MKKDYPSWFKQPWFKQRSIIHFDRKLPFKHAHEYVSKSENIAKHSFYPFIHFTLIKKSHERDKSTNKHGKLLPLREPKTRSISYASHLDSHVFSFYAEELSKKYETLLENEDCKESIIAYRKLGKSNINFASIAFKKLVDICKVDRQCSVVSMCYDIEGFYDNLDHKILKERLCEVLKLDHDDKLPKDYFNIYKAVTKFSWVNKEDILKTLKINKRWLSSINSFCKNGKEFREKIRANKLIRVNQKDIGIPQGSSISPLLSNIYMLSFDREMARYAKEIGAFYQRYSDDILWICSENYKCSSKQKVQEEIEKLNLRLNEDKTKISWFKYSDDKGIENVSLENKYPIPLEYLGFAFDGKRCLLRNKTLSNYYIKLNKFIAKLKRLATFSKKDNDKIYLGKLYKRFSHLGKKKGKKTNFILYALDAHSVFENAGLTSGIKHQIKKHWAFIHQQIKREKIMEVEAIGVTHTFGKNKEGNEVDFAQLLILQLAESYNKRNKLETEASGKIQEEIYINIELYERLKKLTFPCKLRLETEEKVSRGQIVQEIKNFEEITS